MKSFRGGRVRRGGVLVMTLVFVVMFLVIFVGLSGLVTRSHHESVTQSNEELAFQIAENGLNYAKWRLAHSPDNYDAETRTVTDQFAGDLGEFTLTFTPPQLGESAVTINSVGETEGANSEQVTLEARYGRPSLARFSSITNGDVWYSGSISGPVHANGGIRMDGSSDSLMTSAMETYPCQRYHSCNRPFETKPGIWGSGVIQELWDFPVAPIDYNALTLDLLDMKAAAQALDTYYDHYDGGFGYQIELHDDNTYSIYQVTDLIPTIRSWWDGRWAWASHDVEDMTWLETKAIPSGGVIFVADTTWLRGDVRDRLTIASGLQPGSSAQDIDIILNGNISYGGVRDGTRALAAVAERHVQIPWSGAPDDMVLDGAYVAQLGSFHRRYYFDKWGGELHNLKNSLTRYGMIASNGAPGTAWVDEDHNVVSGFQSGQASYDPNFLYNPPPYFPSGGQYDFISWEQL